MIKIAICDDEQAQCALLKRYVSLWGSSTGRPVQIHTFCSSEQFLFRWDEDKSFDLLVLDIEMGSMNGMELAKKLRREKADVGIVFVTGFEQYMSEGYEVEALHYLLKPVQKEKLFAVLERATAREAAEKRHVFGTREGAVSLPLPKVWYVEAQKHTCVLHAEGGVYVLPQGIGSIRQELAAEPDFQTCHRSYLVNLKRVSAIFQTELVLDNGERLPVSRGMSAAVNQAFIRCYR